jgi:hypothetical protein
VPPSQALLGACAVLDLVCARDGVSTDSCAGQGHDILSVSGIVPDGVSAVFLTAPDDTAVLADAKDNAYVRRRAAALAAAARLRVDRRRWHALRPAGRRVREAAGPRVPADQQAHDDPAARLTDAGLRWSLPGGARAHRADLAEGPPPAVRPTRPSVPPPVTVGCVPTPPVVLAAPPAVPKRHK